MKNKFYEDEEKIILTNNIVEMSDIIEELFEEQQKKRGKPSKEWKEKINSLIEHVNKVGNFKRYNPVV